MSIKFHKASYAFVYIFSVNQEIIHKREIINFIIRCNDKCVYLTWLIFHPAVINKKFYCKSFCGDVLHQQLWLVPSSLRSLWHVFHTSYSPSLSLLPLFAYCAHFPYVNFRRLELLPSSIPCSPISSTYLTFVLTLKDQFSARIIVAPGSEDILMIEGKGDRTDYNKDKRSGVPRLRNPTPNYHFFPIFFFPSTTLFSPFLDSFVFIFSSSNSPICVNHVNVCVQSKHWLYVHLCGVVYILVWMLVSRDTFPGLPSV